MNVLLLDNYDSFTFNLLHIIEQYVGIEVDVFRNDKIQLDDIYKYDSIIISPGPGLPHDAGILMPMLEKYKSVKKILGVCLGHQAIGLACGCRLKNLSRVLHGVSRKTVQTEEYDSLFRNIPKVFKSGHYHSWVIDRESLTPELKITALDEEGNIMAIRHVEYKMAGIQFHPESILTEYGKELIFNWLDE
ncbi:MAG: aminodeoxychorismate/anthranilate synthase component II [Bacteroidetes bacterium]|nr:MAG: aminodeoxychorismate/anthranilate synthase component II [Bacteroidota bacterium]REK08141.1 MAG: aminodeoxychorismate/anthranilate synthase component II [Bacteroidota bacterium]REK32346.1 MAG: aminodeoxychorismate/anthranilate synthase component II [Bacteroidota bacterium]REK49580.1 MAG: aminodeoxychorismate/anthranilate synthase component II [Bacteroidota bacterium]